MAKKKTVRMRPTMYSFRKCPCSSVSFNKKDIGTMWLVQYNDGKYTGELAITIGEKAKETAEVLVNALRESRPRSSKR